jgi:hypothetical protein
LKVGTEKKLQELENRRAEIDNFKNYNINMGGHFEEQLEDELSEFEDKRALKVIFVHEDERRQ